MIVSLVFTRKEPLVRLHDRDKIRCPKCSWEPAKSDRWCCETTCNCVWNTFETRGVCPRCDKQWEHTVCLQCLQWSRHEDWYAAE